MADDLSKLFPTLKAGVPWPLTYEGKNKTHMLREVLENHVPDSRQQLIYFINDNFYDGGREGNEFAENVATLLDFPLGLAHGTYDATRATAEGRPRDGAMSLAMGILPPPLKRGAGEVKQTVKKIFNEAPPTPNQVPKPQLTPPIIRPAKTNLVVPNPSIIRPDTKLMLPQSSSISMRRNETDRREETEFTPKSSSWGRSSPWLAPRGPLGKEQRDITLDYPGGAIVDETGRIRYDIEGRPLVAKYIAGWKKLGQRDTGITPSNMRSILHELNVPIVRVPWQSLEKNALGQYVRDWNSPGRIEIWDRLPDDQADVVLAHEFGHVIDRLIGYPRTYGLNDELNRLYSENITGQLNPQRRIVPRDRGYDRDHYRAEKLTEAIRTQSVLPNTIKSIAPKTAALLRKLINEHPILSKLYQVNGIPAGLVVGAGAMATAGGQNESQAKQPHTESSASEPDTKVNMRKIAAALPEFVRRKPIPTTLELIARALLNQRTRQPYGGPR